MSQFERAAVEGRLAILKRALCDLGLSNLPIAAYAKQLRRVLSEIDELQAKLGESSSAAPLANDPASSYPADFLLR